MRVIVVGAGIAGLSTAWSLVKRGHQVTLLEQGEIPNPLAASGDHHRIIRRAYGKAQRLWPRYHRGLCGLGRVVGRPRRKPSRPARLPVRVARCRRRGRGISRRAGGGRLSVRADRRRTRPCSAGRSSKPARSATPSSRRKAGRCIAARSPPASAAGCARMAPRSTTNSKVAWVDADAGRVELAERRDLAGRPRRGHRRRLGAETVSRSRRRAENLPHGSRLSRPAGRPRQGLARSAGHPRCRRQDRRLHHPALRRRRAEIRLGPAQGARPATPTGTARPSKARARRSATCFRRRSPAYRNIG